MSPEPISPELVLVFPELRLVAPYGPDYRRKPTPPGNISTAKTKRPVLDTVEMTLRVPLVLLAVASAVWEVLLLGTMLLVGIVATIGVIMLVTR